MSRFQSFFLAATILCLCCAPAPAQTVANVSIVSGSGQLTCPTCPYLGGVWQYFEPMVVKVTDSGGSPISGAAVTWSTTGGVLFDGAVTVTNANGIAQNRLWPGVQTPGATYMQQDRVTATAGGVSVTFIETQGLMQASLQTAPLAALRSPDSSAAFSGVSGSQSDTKIKVHVGNGYEDIPNVSVRLVNANGASGAVSCETAPGADPGSTLTDANGNAVCIVVFGSAIGEGQRFTALVGGVNNVIGVNPQTEIGKPFGLAALGNFTATVTAAIASKIAISGSTTADPGTGVPLHATVTDSAGTAKIANATVLWTVTPGTAASAVSSTTVTGTDGVASNTIALTGSASGAVTVTATLASNPSVSATFTILVGTPAASITSLTKISGEPQSAAKNTPYTNPLVVRVAGNAGPLPNVPVHFTVTSGYAALTPDSGIATTGQNGQAQISVRAGLTVGPLVITATAGNLSQAFNLTVTEEGPQVTAAFFINGAQAYTSYDDNHSALSPCSIGIAGNGFTPTTPGLSAIKLGPLAASLSGVSISFNGKQAPIYSVANLNGAQQVAFQVPCDLAPGNAVPVSVTVNGATTTTNVIVRAAGPGIFESDANQSDGKTRAVLIKADGTFVSDTNRARKGEVIRVLVTGMGATIPAVSGSNALPPAGIDALVSAWAVVGVNNAGTRLVKARLSPTLVGVYEVDFEVPSDAPSGTDVVITLAVNATDGSATQWSPASKIPIQ